MYLLGTLIRRARQKKGFSLFQLQTAMKIKISLFYLKDIEDNKTIPGVSIVKELASLLEIPIEQIQESLRRSKLPRKFYYKNNISLTK